MLKMQKYQGLGNDYLILNPKENELKLEEKQISFLCRRNFGIGADGILYGPIEAGEKQYIRIFNSDGSEACHSGNGVIIFAKYLKDTGNWKEKKGTLYTKAGKFEIEFLGEKEEKIRVCMGKPVFACDKIPVVGDIEEIVNEPLLFHGNLYNATCVSVGTPNCVIMMENVSGQKVRELGPYVENASYFPNQANLQLCHMKDEKHIELEIYERGAGYTLSSGTGACAAAASAYRLGVCGKEVMVTMPGGELLIEIESDFTMYMTGRAEKIGTFYVAEHFFA